MTTIGGIGTIISQIVYMEAEGDVYKRQIRASSSMPILSKAVLLDGKRYLDGGCAMAIPYRRAIDSGFEKIVLVLTRQKGYRKLYTPLSLIHI